MVGNAGNTRNTGPVGQTGHAGYAGERHGLGERRDLDDRGSRTRRRGQGQLEAQVLAVLGSATTPVAATWVQERLDGELAYTTVITILTRLLGKQAVTRTRSGRSFLWTPVADEAGLTALRMRRLLDERDDRDAVLSSFVSALSPHDERVLRSLLSAADATDHTTAPGTDRSAADEAES